MAVDLKDLNQSWAKLRESEEASATEIVMIRTVFLVQNNLVDVLGVVRNMAAILAAVHDELAGIREDLGSLSGISGRLAKIEDDIDTMRIEAVDLGKCVISTDYGSSDGRSLRVWNER